MKCTLHQSGRFWLVIMDAPGLWLDAVYETPEEALAAIGNEIMNYKENN